jgi:hypothetical protein
MERLQRIFSSVGGGGGAGAGPPGDTPQVDTSEQVYISSLALLKMLKHGAPLPRRGAAWRFLGVCFSARTALKKERVVVLRACVSFFCAAQGARACRWR